MCKHEFVFSQGCGANVCQGCGLHAHLSFEDGSLPQELARCWCGWSDTGGNGRGELWELGEDLMGDDSWLESAYEQTLESWYEQVNDI